MKIYASFLFILMLTFCISTNDLCFNANAISVINDPVTRIYTKISIDSIKNLYEPLMQSEKYDELVSKQKKVLELSLKIYEPNSSEIAEENHWLGYFLAQCENYSEAILYIQASANIYSSLGSEYLGEYFDVLEKIALYHYGENKMEDTLKAYLYMLDEFYHKNSIIIETYLKALRMSLIISERYQIPITIDRQLEFLFSEYIEDEDKFNLYSDVINYYINKNNPYKAIEVYKFAEAITIRKTKYLTYEKWGDILLNIVNAYSSICEYDEAIDKLKKAEAVYKEIANPINDYYVHYSMGNIRHQQFQMQLAYNSYDQAIKTIDRLDGMKLAKANLLALQARCMLALNKRDKASKLVEEAINLIDAQQQTASHEIIEIYDVFSRVAFQKGCYGEVITCLNKVKETYMMNDFFCQQIDLNMGMAYAKIGDFNNAVLIADRLSLSLPDDNKSGEISKTEFESYLSRVISLATIYSLSDRLSDALHLLNRAYKMCELHRFSSGEIYNALLNNLGLYNLYLGNYEDAKKLSLLSLEFNQSNMNRDYLHLFETLSNLFLISLHTKDKESLNYYAQLSFEAMQNIELVNFAEVETYFRNLLHYFVVVDDLERAETISTYIQSEASKVYGKESKRYYQAISSTIYLYEAKQDWDSLITLASAILNNYDNDLHLRRAPIYYSLLNACMRKGDTSKSSDILREIYQYEVDKVQMLASNFDSRERLYLLNDIQNYIISMGCSFISENNLIKSIKDSTIETIYNSVLLFKGLNLQIDKNANNEIAKLQIYTMQEVQSQLSPKECAIEFVDFETSKGREYGALILSSDNTCEFVTIGSELELLTTPTYERYSNVEYSKIIWGNIIPHIGNKSTIYFSACGELHNIGIEYLQSLSNEEIISDQYNIYRLSSTRELLNGNNNIESKNIALFGGMLYDEYPIDKFAYSQTPSLNIPNDNLEVFRGKNYKYLPATLKEVNLIDSIFHNSNLGSIKFIGLEASESSFKSLVGNYPSILHIATHGIYWDEKSLKKDNRWVSFIESYIGNDKTNEEDFALSRSVLLFSGAQKFLSEVSNTVYKGDDGILTALELSKLNLSMVDLVVLSACQTGLGDVKGDGVFGLQRGLKKAGVNSILMSLWEVDDEATSMLMVEFYKNLSKGINKQESLKMAQRKVRKTPGFDNPDNWAAFILLDGLN